MDNKYVESKSDFKMDNCRRVTGLTLGKYTCELCNDGYYYDTGDNSCKQNCTNNYRINDLNLTTPIAIRTNHRQCVTDNSVTNCLTYSSSFTGADSKCV